VIASARREIAAEVASSVVRFSERRRGLSQRWATGALFDNITVHGDNINAKNNGSGGLNPLNGQYLNEFRAKEGVDTSYTKDFADFWDGDDATG